jgi:hypothetical protein
LTSSDVDGYLMEQAVMRFASDAARGSALGTAVGAGTALAEGMMSYLDDENTVQVFNGTSWSPVGVFDSVEVITATNATWSVPTLGISIVHVTCVGAGGGATGGGATDGGGGGSTSFGAFGTASGGLGGRQNDDSSRVGGAGFRSGNEGTSNFSDGQGGQVKDFMVNLSGVSTVNVTIGAGGAGNDDGSNGGRGEVIVRYKAG